MEAKLIPIEDNTKYYITENGEVWNNDRGKFMSQSITHNGYKRIGLHSLKCKQKMYFVHRLVALIYVNNPLNKPFINHIDGDKSNNSYLNLEWCTRDENMIHAELSGLMTEAHQKQRKAILKKIIDIETGEIFESSYEASIKYGLTRVYISKMLCGWNRNTTTLKYL